MRPASTSMSVVLPAPEEPMRAVRMPGWNAPLQPRRSCRSLTPSTVVGRGPTFSGSVVSMAYTLADIWNSSTRTGQCWQAQQPATRFGERSHGLHACCNWGFKLTDGTALASSNSQQQGLGKGQSSAHTNPADGVTPSFLAEQNSRFFPPLF